MRYLVTLLALLAALAIAHAQTIPLPQTSGPPALVSGIDSTGHLIFHVPTIGDIATPNPQTSSTANLFFGGPQIQFGLDNPNGFVTGSILFVQIPSLQDNFAYCVATNIDFFGLVTCNITFMQGGMFAYTGDLAVTLINGYTTNSVPPWAGQGVDGTTAVSVPTPGRTVSLTIDAGKVFQYSSPVYCYAFNDPQNTWFAGFVTSYNTSSGAMNVVAQFISPSASTQTGYTCSLAPLAQNNASLNNWASDTLTIPSTVPSDLTFTTVVASQYFPIQGQALITCTTDTTKQVTGQVKAYSGSTMVVTVTSVLAGGGTSCSAWAFYLTTGPTTRISLYQMNGLLISGTLSGGLTVQKGCVRDSTDTVDLCLAASQAPTAIGKQVTGTASVSTTGVVTGSGTAFTTEFSAAGTLTDLNDQLTNIGFPTVSAGVIFSNSLWSVSVPIASIASDTSMQTNLGVGIASGNVYRGLGPSSGFTGFPQTWGAIIARQDSTGVTNTYVVSFTRSGVPDLPSGYTFYRALGYVAQSSNTAVTTIVQPLLLNVAPNTPKAVYSATIAPTALGINESSLSTVTGLITFASDFTGAPLTTGMSVVLTGTVSTGLTTGTGYYVCVQSVTTLFLYNTNQKDAKACGSTGKVIPSVNNNPGWSLRYFSYTNVFNAGFDAVAPIGATPGSTTMHWDFNLTNALADATKLRLQCNAAGIFNSAAAQKDFWLFTAQNGSVVKYSASSTTLITYSGTILDASAATTQGTWAQQGTTFWTQECTVWGALDEPIPANDNDLIERMVA